MNRKLGSKEPKIRLKLFTGIGSCACAHLAFASQLQVYDEPKQTLFLETKDPQEIETSLKAAGVYFAQWNAPASLTSDSTSAEIQEAYASDIERLKIEHGFQTVDVLSMFPEHPKKVELRQKFLNEHTHSEPEIRFFVAGSGKFFLHIQERVYVVLCERGDLISVPENTPRWFDMGTEPYFTAIRFFTKPEGWIAHFTGSPIAQAFVN